MKSFSKIGVIFLLFILPAASICQINLIFNNSFSENGGACNDFFAYANRQWLDNTEIPPDQSRWGSFEIVGLRNRLVLKTILESKAKNKTNRNGSPDHLLGNFYDSCMNEGAIEKNGITPLKPALETISAVKNSKELTITAAKLHKLGVPALFFFASTIDIKNSARRIAGASQPSFGLNREYYVKDDENSNQIRTAYLAHISEMFRLLGEDQTQSRLNAAAVLAIETRLAQVSQTPAELRNAERNYNLISSAELNSAAPNIYWTDYLKARGVPNVKQLNLAQPSFFRELNGLITQIPLNEWKAYLRWQLVRTVAPFLSAQFDRENFKFFGRFVSGTRQQQPRWRRCVDWANSTFGESLGQDFVKTAFSAESLDRVLKITLNIIAAFREKLIKLEWMSDETKRQAIVKLNALKYRIGYPNSRPKYPRLVIIQNNFAENILRMAEFNDKVDLQSIGKAPDKIKWNLNPQTNNASYDRAANQITLPAGILQPPFFNPEADDSTNYGAIGAIIGHEITHGFDDQGSKFDAKGILNQWWTDEDRRKFVEKTNCLVEQYNSYEVDKSIFVNGKLTLSENIADLGGLSIAYHALRKALANGEISSKKDELTPEQRFFFGWARQYISKSRIEALRLQVKGDPHTPRHLRVNGVLSNMPEFAEVYRCKTGDSMIHIPRCRIW
jgi:putative endopeptidase